MRDNSEKFNWKGIEFPVSLKQIDKFEKQNPFPVNVFGIEGEKVYPLRISKEREKQVIDLLLISKGETTHYCWVKNKGRLLSSQTSKHKSSRFFCDRCINQFPNKPSLEKHLEYCSNNEAVRIEFPRHKDKDGVELDCPVFLKFKNFNRSMRVPFVVYADFECFTEKIQTCYPDDSRSFTNQYQHHKPSGFCYLIKCFDGEIMKPKLVQYTAESVNEDISKKCIDSVEYEIRSIYRKFKFKKKIKMTRKDEIAFQNAEICHICDQKLDNDKVRDHCHLTGKYRGAAHDYCNKNYQIPKFFPVIFHNLTGYDSHIFIKNLGESETSAMGSKIPGLINCIPNNEEKYISFTKDIEVDRFMEKDEKTGEDKKVIVKREIRFIDSFKFMASSLDKLTANLDESALQCVQRFFSGEQFDLVRRKGVYPYDYMDGLSKFQDTKLPPQEQFYSELNHSYISDDDYEHARKVWKYFDMKTMKDYHKLYLKTDVLLLADVFENFRDVCIENYKLDPAWYYTAPGLAWNACLKKTGVRLELLNDIDMLLMIEKGIRGGVSTITKRYAKANNPYMKTYDSNSLNKYITYLNANNLYGWAMSQPLPTHGFEWMSEEELKNWRSHSGETSEACILEVDLEYPKELHDLHNDYPLAPERLKIGGIEKLIPNLYDKKNYVVHHETLKQYESLGLKITKIYRGIKFEESAWLQPYIILNTELRTKAKNDFEKDFFKLIIVYSERRWRILETELIFVLSQMKIRQGN